MTDQQPRTTGTATSRARQLRPAVRRPTLARLALSGPSGSGKTWTALSIAEVLAPGGRVVVIDTERGDDEQGAAELYADQFSFETIEWPAPYDPRDLAITLRDLGNIEPRPDVVIIDSASHFWRAEGGTLDIAGGRFGGWRVATPAQDDLVGAILASRSHVITCLRARQDYAVEEQPGGKQKVTKLGLAPVQRDDLEYEFQVVLTLDMDHRIDVGKTRAQPLAGSSWPAGQQARFAATYRDWLKSGVQLARADDVEALREVLRTAELGKEWQAAGWPKVAQLDAARLDSAWGWLALQLGISPHPVEQGDDGQCRRCGSSWRARWHTNTHPVEAPEPEDDGAPFEPLAITEDRTPEQLAADGDAPEPAADEGAESVQEGTAQEQALAAVAATLA
jgi:hypothetical protein